MNIKAFTYCPLCRAEETTRYGDLVYTLPDFDNADNIAQHQRACYDAKCNHYPFCYERELASQECKDIFDKIEAKLGNYEIQNDY